MKIEISLESVSTEAEMHTALKSALGFPSFYGMNWHAFWDAITGLVKMPNELILIGWRSFSFRMPEEARLLKYKLDQYIKEYDNQIDIRYED